jgi:hypothetical protein
MKFSVTQAGVMSGSQGDIFWDLAPWIVYSAGFDLGCNIYVANPTDVEKEYALIAQLTRNTVKISEEAIPVFGYAWFKVDPGDFVTLKGALRFSDSNADLTVSLVERETQEAIDSVVTTLVAPSVSALPPRWPGVPATTTDWMSLMMPLMMMAMLGMVMVTTFRPKEQKTKITPPVREERKLLPPGRKE